MRYVYAIVKDGTTTPDDDILTGFLPLFTRRRHRRRARSVWVLQINSKLAYMEDHLY